MSEVRNTRRFGVAEVQRIDPVRPLERRRSGDEPHDDGRDDQQQAPKDEVGHDAEHGTEHIDTDVTYDMDGELPVHDDDGDDAVIDEYV